METVRIVYSKEDFLETTKPYEALYALKNTPLQHEQTLEAIQANARAVGVRNFKQMYEAFLKTGHRKEAWT